jgi:hypothetical protein
MNLQGIAIPFFTESQWIAARTVMEDGTTFHNSYADFVQLVVNKELELRAQGKSTIRINIDPQAFVDWCGLNGRKVNAESRAIFAAWKAAQADRGRGN